MIKNKITVAYDESQSFDKMQIALAIRNSTYEDNLDCPLLVNNIISSCEGCNLKFICEKIDDVAEEYLESTTKIISNFSF